MDAIHAFFAIPEVFAGDPKHAPNPDDQPEIYGYYRRIFRVRKQFPELMHGDILLREVVCDNPDVFVGIRRDGSHASLLIVSLSDKAQKAEIQLPDFLSKATAGTITLTDCLTGKAQSEKLGGGKVSLSVGAYGVLHGRVY